MNVDARSTRRRRLLAVLVAIAAAVAIAHVTATSAQPGAPRPGDEAAAIVTRPLPAAPPDVPAPAGGPRDGRHWRAVARARLRVLRQPHSVTADAVPPAVASQPTTAGIDLAAARRVTGSGGEQAWIAPSSDGSSVCAVRSGAVACSATMLLEVTGLSPAINGRGGEPYHVWGTAGDDVRSLVLVEGDGTRVAVTVTDNFFDVATDDWPRSLTWTGPSGPESFVFPPDFSG
ncbi:hypothetical protein Q5424_18720 [Conexibacter sp. JD483]|uniref:hypothetical protein n=1 Tax=unclassified Conexibacter TaxID=2627773 RepID=UPI002721F8FA|nr:MULTISPECIES: hypothetical protein [unclassified Conexibacter]MDO8186371.1 hypothetical protein [Conexibacter sp. CPCC 205706]MDO8199770.1 hypothetical protein [Conexibacter sp. CPCC 205762]MDR9371137.1 hypothetical protein [Conexibacter sp. JD483]